MTLRMMLVVLAACGAARASDAAAARRGLEAILPAIGSAERARLTRLLDAHAADVARAREFLFDRERYPSPASGRSWRIGVDKQPGHGEMSVRVVAAIVSYNAWVKALARALRLRTDVAGAKKATKAVHGPRDDAVEYGILTLCTGMRKRMRAARTKYAAYRKAAGDDAGTASPAVLFGALAAGDSARAVAEARSLTGLDAAIGRALAAHFAMLHNREARHGHDDADLAGVRTLNAYRLSLGFRPLLVHPQLHAMALDFAEQQSKFSFPGHVHPSDPSRKTPPDRARRVGYPGGVNENCSHGPDPAVAPWAWRSDAGHHRALFDRALPAVGLGHFRGYTVLNCGTDVPASSRFLIELLDAFGVDAPR